MNDTVFKLNQMFARRRKTLNQISAKQIRDGDFFPRSNKTLQEINLAIFENNVTDVDMLRRYSWVQ